jgi:hypothetical protein
LAAGEFEVTFPKISFNARGIFSRKVAYSRYEVRSVMFSMEYTYNIVVEENTR